MTFLISLFAILHHRPRQDFLLHPLSRHLGPIQCEQCWEQQEERVKIIPSPLLYFASIVKFQTLSIECFQPPPPFFPEKFTEDSSPSPRPASMTITPLISSNFFILSHFLNKVRLFTVSHVLLCKNSIVSVFLLRASSRSLVTGLTTFSLYLSA